MFGSCFMDCWLLAFAFMYVAMDFYVFIIIHFTDTLVLIYRDFLCYLVYRGCKLTSFLILNYLLTMSTKKTWWLRE